MIYTTPNSNGNESSAPAARDVGPGSDRWLLIAIISLMVFGVLAVYSAIYYFAETNQTSAGSMVANHVIKLCIAFAVLLIASKIDYHKIVSISRVLVVVSWILLLVVHFWGESTFGARRSLSIGGFSFQPAALASVALLMYVSALLFDKQEYIKSFSRAFMPILIWVFITCALIGLQDFSSAATLMLICLMIMFIGRINALHVFTLMLIGVVGASALVMSSPERMSRVEHYVDQIVDINNQDLQLDEGYQSQQAQIAIARGGLFGVGIGKSTQRDFLPAPYNDFIYAIIAEEYGLLGAIVLLAVYTLILFRGLAVVARKAPDALGTMLATGCTLMITIMGYINAGVATGLLPVTGLPMPFVSYGGTSMMMAGFMAGILLNISKQRTDQKHYYFG